MNSYQIIQICQAILSISIAISYFYDCHVNGEQIKFNNIKDVEIFMAKQKKQMMINNIVNGLIVIFIFRKLLF